jgi:6-pyruvoyltetrahydropterin/6-carboxytetrahydropterin synthase
MGKWVSTKNYGPEEGFSVCYRQWRADRKSGKSDGSLYTRDEIPGCNALHGYALGIYVEFEGTELDARNWICDFGSLRSFKEFLKENFDHTMLVAFDDPEYQTFVELHNKGLAKMVEVEATGCEALAKFLYDYLNEIWLPENYPDCIKDDHGAPYTDEPRIRCRKVVVRETPSNAAWYEG